MKKTTYPVGNFKLIIVIGQSKTEVPAHPGNISRDAARKLQKTWRAARPEAVTRVRKAA